MKTFEVRFRRSNQWDIYKERELLQTITVQAEDKTSAIDMVANKWSNINPVIERVLEKGIDEDFECYPYLCRRHSLDRNCWAIFRRYGYGDHALIHEYMPDENGDFFDNEGHDKMKYESESHLTRVIDMKFNCHAEVIFDANEYTFSKAYCADLERIAKERRKTK